MTFGGIRFLWARVLVKMIHYHYERTCADWLSLTSCPKAAIRHGELPEADTRRLIAGDKPAGNSPVGGGNLKSNKGDC
jgi:hypothetical protein